MDLEEAKFSNWVEFPRHSSRNDSITPNLNQQFELSNHRAKQQEGPIQLLQVVNRLEENSCGRRIESEFLNAG